MDVQEDSRVDEWRVVSMLFKLSTALSDIYEITSLLPNPGTILAT